MERKWLRIYLVELLGAFALVYFSAGVVLINHVTSVSPAPQEVPNPTHNPLTGTQPGLAGMALAQGLILAVMLLLTVPVSGGYLNPAVTIMLWVFNRIDTLQMIRLLGAQLLGAVLAGLCLKYTFKVDVLQAALFGTPHVNLPVYGQQFLGARYAGAGIEFVLTFFLVFAIFGLARQTGHLGWASVAAGAVLAAGVLVAFPLTGAATNPARWFGTVLWEWWDWQGDPRNNPFADVFVYIAGPVAGALLAGLFCFKMYLPALEEADPETKGKK